MLQESSESGKGTDDANASRHYRRAWRRMHVLGISLLFVSLVIFIVCSKTVAVSADAAQYLCSGAFFVGMIISGFFFTSRCPRCEHLFFFGPDWEVSCTQLKCMNCGLKRGSLPQNSGETSKETPSGNSGRIPTSESREHDI